MSSPNPNSPSECQPESGQIVPRVDRSRCEAKSKCEPVCPYNVFMVRRLEPDERQGLGLFDRLKLALHGGQQAVVIAPADCHACRLCVQVCPTDAITLVPL